MARIVDRQERKSALVHAAATIFAENGFANTKISDIAIQAGVGKGTVYEYFSSKEELFFAVLTWTSDEISRRLDKRLISTDSARDQLQTLLEESTEIISEMTTSYSLNLDFWATCRGSNFEGRFKQAIEEMYERYRLMVAEIILRGQQQGEFTTDVDAERVAAVVVGAFDGLGIQSWIDGALDLTGCARSFHTLLLAGMKPTAD